MFSDKKLLALLEQYPETTRFWVAYSGGLDSQVLLYALSNILPKTRLRAVHINHGWHTDAVQWTESCRQTCAQLGVFCEVITVDAQPKQGESPEACARKARYAAMAKLIQTEDCLLTAHHRDDQAETLLLQLLRGAGLPGLASMPGVMSFGKGRLVRPLLKFTRLELQAYAEERQLTWIEDSSNTNLRFNRNFVRHQVLPLLKQRWPELSKTLARAAENTAEAQQLLQEFAHEDWLKVREPSTNNLVISRLLYLTPARRRNCLRYWLKQLGFSLPSQMQLQQIELLLKSKRDANPEINWGDFQVRRYRDFLYALVLKKESKLSHLDIPPAPEAANFLNSRRAVFRSHSGPKQSLCTAIQEENRDSPLENLHREMKHLEMQRHISKCNGYIAWDLKQALTLPTGNFLTVDRVIGNGIACDRLRNKSISIGFRQGGERFHVQGRLGSHPLKKLFQEWGIPPWQRQEIPLIYYEEKLIGFI